MRYIVNNEHATKVDNANVARSFVEAMTLLYVHEAITTYKIKYNFNTLFTANGLKNKTNKLSKKKGGVRKENIEASIPLVIVDRLITHVRPNTSRKCNAVSESECSFIDARNGYVASVLASACKINDK